MRWSYPSTKSRAFKPWSAPRVTWKQARKNCPWLQEHIQAPWDPEPLAALEIATGAIHTQTTQLKRRTEFLTFMDQVVADLPNGKEIHVILDNYCIHKKNDVWLSAHPNVHFHFTPTSASWLNQVKYGSVSFPAKRSEAPTLKVLSNYAKPLRRLLLPMAQPPNLLSGGNVK